MLDVTTYPVVDAQERDHPCHSIRRWACVYTRPQAERWADSGLRRQGYATYLPLLTTTRRDRVTPSMRHRVEVPAFPRYLFIQFDASVASWSPIRATPGVLDLVRNGSQLQYASQQALEAVRTALEARPHPDTTWAPGAACSLAQGPLASMPAIILRCTNDTATIACLFLGELREITVPVDAIVSRHD